MEPKDLQEKIEENLEYLWVHAIEKIEPEIKPLQLPYAEAGVIESLRLQGFILITDGLVTLTETGLIEARTEIRRHRLSERLFADLFEVKSGSLHDRACRMEHLLAEGVEDKVCTLLGHPRTCPHGTAIPEGQCCREAAEQGTRRVLTLSELPIGRKARIVYVMSDKQKEINKIISMGVEPGSEIVIERRFPSYIFLVGNSRFAVDESIAESIFVKPL